MKYGKVFVLFTLAAVASCSSMQSARQGDNPHRLLWEISGEELRGPSYLYGTIHIKDKRAFDFSDSVLPAFERCEAFAAELDLDSARSVALTDAMYMQDTTLADLIGPEDMQVVDSVFTELIGVGLELFPAVKPIFLGAMITGGLLPKDKPYTLDEYFFREAKTRGKLFFPLEHIHEQIEAMDAISLQDQADQLVELTRNLDQSDSLVEQMVVYYRAGDLEGLQRIMQEAEQSGIGEVAMDAFLTKRNAVMTKRISGMIREYPTFITVGAGHLPGDDGLIRYLSEEGFSLRPVQATFAARK